jgi:hypothetical protein
MRSSLHSTTIYFPTPPLHFTSLHFTSLHFTAFSMTILRISCFNPEEMLLIKVTENGLSVTVSTCRHIAVCKGSARTYFWICRTERQSCVLFWSKIEKNNIIDHHSLRLIINIAFLNKNILLVFSDYFYFLRLCYLYHKYLLVSFTLRINCWVCAATQGRWVVA